MKIAIVNNGSSEPKKIEALVGGKVSVFSYIDALNICKDDFDLIVLSGSSRSPIVYNKHKLQNEITLIQRADTPILGICYVAELIKLLLAAHSKTLEVKTKREA